MAMNTNTNDSTAASGVVFDPRALTESQFAQLGAGQIAYVKPVVVDGKQVFAIHAANGTPMALAEDQGVAVAAIIQHEMVPAAVH